MRAEFIPPFVPLPKVTSIDTVAEFVAEAKRLNAPTEFLFLDQFAAGWEEVCDVDTKGWTYQQWCDQFNEYLEALKL